ncbi:septal ring lytic transglycosylase RlpA family protein [Herbaspirillum sp. GCM10030257]
MIGCNSVPVNPPAETASRPAPVSTVPKTASNLPALPPAGSGRGGYYKDDGPGDAPPEGLLDTPDAEPRVEPYYARNSRPYVVFGKTYTPITHDKPFKQRGVGSWYGKKFHGQKTSSGELYDMYKMTAAHPTLPIPSYVRVTNLTNGKQVIVRVNDRGPFHSGRIIDLSYTAALKLGYLSSGSSQLEVERLLPDEIARINNAAKDTQLAAAKPAPPVTAASPQPVQSRAAVELASAPAPASAAVEAKPIAFTSDTTTFALPDTVPVSPQADSTSIKPTIVVSPVANAGSGYYLQLGAYGQAANAEAVRNRLMKEHAGTLAAIEVVEFGTFHRLFSGPFATRADAAIAATQLQERGIRAMIVQR